MQNEDYRGLTTVPGRNSSEAVRLRLPDADYFHLPSAVELVDENVRKNDRNSVSYAHCFSRTLCAINS